jgi:hypothetical protein
LEIGVGGTVNSESRLPSCFMGIAVVTLTATRRVIWQGAAWSEYAGEDEQKFTAMLLPCRYNHHIHTCGNIDSLEDHKIVPENKPESVIALVTSPLRHH